MVPQVTTSGTTSDNKWQRVIQQMTAGSTTSDNEWCNKWKRMKANESDFRFQNETIMQCITTKIINYKDYL